MTLLLNTQIQPDAVAHIQLVPKPKPVQIAPTNLAHGAHHSIAEKFHQMAHIARLNEMREQRRLLADIQRQSNKIGLANLGGAIACATLGVSPVLVTSYQLLPLKVTSSIASFLYNIWWIRRIAEETTFLEDLKKCKITKFAGKSIDYSVSWWTNSSQSENKASELRLQLARERDAKSLDDWKTTLRKHEQALQDQHTTALKLAQ